MLLGNVEIIAPDRQLSLRIMGAVAFIARKKVFLLIIPEFSVHG